MAEQRVEFLVEEGGGRLDRLVTDRVAGLSRSVVQGLIDGGGVTVNGSPAKASYRPKAGDLVVACLPARERALPEAEAIPLEVVYEDAGLLVVNKPAGMVVHPAPGHAHGTLVNAVLARCPELRGADDERPGIVHRLDRDTSGLIVVAKSERVRQAMQRQFGAHQVHKVYLALLHGRLEPAWGSIQAPLGRDPHHRQRIAVVPGGREAITEYRTLETFTHRSGSAASEYTLVEARPVTGRTHQIRVHFASIGHPVVADPVYGRRRTALPLSRHFLHAARLAFQHPVSGERIELQAPLHADLAAVLSLLRGI